MKAHTRVLVASTVRRWRMLLVTKVSGEGASVVYWRPFPPLSVLGKKLDWTEQNCRWHWLRACPLLALGWRWKRCNAGLQLLSYIFSGLIITSILFNLLRFDVAGWSFKCVVHTHSQARLLLCSRGDPIQQLKHLTRAWGAMSVNEETCSTHGMVSESAESGIYPAWYWCAAYSSGGI